MPHQRASMLPALVLVSLLSAPASHAEAPSFERDIRPTLQGFCLQCHGERKPKAGINLAAFRDEESVRRDPDLSLRVVDALSERTMPPKGKPAPPEADRERAARSIEAILDAIDDIRDPGQVPIQRLTREQYNNTIRDLLGVDTRPADAFPADGGGGSGFDNNGSTLFVPPILMEKYLAAATEILDRAEPDRYLVVRPGDGVPADEAARRCIESFATRAFRRPAGAEEVERLIRLFGIIRRRGGSFDETLKRTLRAVLVAPSFLFLIERERDVEGPYRIDDHELASRLSYFLWSSMPDRDLTDLAARGTLHEPGVLVAEVRRMLADPRSRAFARDFAGQWLRLGSLPRAEPDGRGIAGFTPELRAAMIEEATTFFHALLRDDAPLLDLVGADYAYLNELLARHYGIEGVTGPEFRRVALHDPNRGGVLGMGAVLTLTSYPRRTSPVLRGKWVLEELLGTPPPPPPPQVKALPQDDRVRKGLTFRQRLEQHRSDASCASCHAKLDPLGFGLESFDTLGRWRTESGGSPVDAAGVLTTGETFTGPAELKKVLLDQKKDLILKNLARRMLSYALRRALEYYDTPAVNEILAKLDDKDHRSTALVVAIVESFPFQYRRNDPITGARP